RPVIMAGTNLYWGHGEEALRQLVDELGVPVFLNGLARGCVPADDGLFFSRARSHALKGADLALVIGVPMDFRLGFGGSFGDETQVVAIDAAPPERPHPRPVTAEAYGALGATLRALREAVGTRSEGSWPAGVAAPRRRSVRLLRTGVRHARAPRRARRGGHGQQRDLGAGEAPDGVPLRLFGGRRPAPGDALRRGRRGAGRPRRARPDSG